MRDCFTLSTILLNWTWIRISHHKLDSPVSKAWTAPQVSGAPADFTQKGGGRRQGGRLGLQYRDPQVCTLRWRQKIQKFPNVKGEKLGQGQEDWSPAAARFENPGPHQLSKHYARCFSMSCAFSAWGSSIHCKAGGKIESCTVAAGWLHLRRVKPFVRFLFDLSNREVVPWLVDGLL